MYFSAWENIAERICVNCKTQETPMWRRHPITGDSLCNPCGMYIRKHRKDRPTPVQTGLGYFSRKFGFLNSITGRTTPPVHLADSQLINLGQTPPEKPPDPSSERVCLICEIEVADEGEYYDHLVGHACTPCSVYIERLDLENIKHNMLNRKENGGDVDDDSSQASTATVKTEPIQSGDGGDVTQSNVAGTPTLSPARDFDNTLSSPFAPPAGATSSPGIRVKTLKDLMPTSTVQNQSSSAVQKLTQQVERLPQAVSISPSVQISKRPAPPDTRVGASRKLPRLPESISLTPAKSLQPPIAPRPNPSLMNRIPPGRGVTVSPIRGSAQTQRIPQQQQFPVSSSVSILPPRKPVPTGQIQQRSHPELRRSLQTRSSSLACQICDRSFTSHDLLQRHMATSHRGSPSNPMARSSAPSSQQSNTTFPCNYCRVIYSSEAALNTHKQRIHAAELRSSIASNRGNPFRGGPAPPELALPIVDVSQRVTKQRLAEKGVKYVVRLTNLTNTDRTARFAIPVVPVEQANNSAYSRVASIGAANIIPLGPLTSVKQ